MRHTLSAACFAVGGAICGLSIATHGTNAASNGDLMSAYRIISSHDFVDLTHAFGPGIAHWPGFPNETVRTLFTYKKDGFFAQEFCHVGQWGTHVDPPAHFTPGGKTVDQIDPKQMFLPLVVIDVHEKVARNPDYVFSMDDVRAWEAKHGPIPTGAFIAMRTDWSKRFGSEAAMQNKDSKGIAHYPGWSLPVLQYLYLQRHAVATGHETTDTDPGLVTSRNVYPLESWILHHGHYQIELLTNLDRVPEAGSLVMVTFPKPRGGSGFPARLIAIVP
ncbi:MAG: cyclase family protein [Candidatus Eremiobacteraeota bacterium]|nr:cyclase family protein [Candidatus Eremiobacteraeota bacterium]